MNSVTSTFQHLKHRISRKFLLIFSICSLSAGGFVWACSDYGFDFGYSSFSPEAFVSDDYKPFFYAEFVAYYGDEYDAPYGTNTNRYNNQVVADWYAYLDKKVDKSALEYLLLKASSGRVDSIYRQLNGKIKILPDSINFTAFEKHKKTKAFFEYLLLAKSAETFAATDIIYSWEPQPPVPVTTEIEKPLLKSFKTAKDPFLKQRLWFQLLRYNYFTERNDSTLAAAGSKTIQLFEQYKDAFPKNMMYYRTLGYVAGWYYKHRNFALSNYLYSLCYNYSREAKISSEWSFKPQEESDWKQTLQLAKSTDEKTSLWQLLGIHYDPQRAIRNIVNLDPTSEKLDLLLARLVNTTEYTLYDGASSQSDSAAKNSFTQNRELVDSIALRNNTGKPYFWNLAAGYLNYLSKNYPAARNFYAKAKTQLPKNNRLVMAQYKILDWTLYVHELKTIDATAEAKMVEPLNWFADLKAQKDTIPSLRFYKALDESILRIAELYKQQGNLIKANAFKNDAEFYAKDQNIVLMQGFLQKSGKTAFEQVMLRYYPFDINDLYYHQALVMAYQDKIDEAITLMNKSESRGTEMLANPFNMRLNDCHDCDFELKQAAKIDGMDVLMSMKKMKKEIEAGKNVYNNALLLANAFYNISFYGNSRVFYETGIIGSDQYNPFDIATTFRPMLLSNKVSEKYYLMAHNAATGKEQKAKCTFMAAKCEKNESYTKVYTATENKDANEWNINIEDVFSGKYFASLVKDYKNTKFYQEILKECGYFRNYAVKNN